MRKRYTAKGNLIRNNFSSIEFENQASITLPEALSEYFKTKPKQFEKRSNTISLYQTSIMMMTITAISAVDFKLFPSRFRKSKTFGLSLVRNGVIFFEKLF